MKILNTPSSVQLVSKMPIRVWESTLGKAHRTLLPGAVLSGFILATVRCDGSSWKISCYV